MSKDKKDYIILTVILALTVFSVILATAFNKGNGNLQTSLSMKNQE